MLAMSFAVTIGLTQGLIIVVYLGIVLLTTAAMSLGYNLARRVYAKSGEVL